MPKTIYPEFEGLRLARDFFFLDHFLSYVDAGFWTKAIADTGSVAATDAHGGVLAIIPSDTSVADNDQASIESTKEIFLFGANKPFAVEADVQFTEANVDDANVAFGVMNASPTDRALGDTGAGPIATTHSSMMIYKVLNSTVWKCESCVVTTQTITASTKTAGGSAYQRLRVEYQPISATQGECSFYMDGVALVDSNGKQIKHTITFASATEMKVFLIQKNGAATNVETLLVHRVALQGLT